MERILELDILRGVAILLILFAHFPIGFAPTVQFWSAVVGLSLFLFISGMVLRPKDSLKDFYAHRARRIYPPYLIVIGIYVVLQIAVPSLSLLPGMSLSATNVIINIAGLQGVLNVPSYGFLWFAGAILLYYAIYPFLGKRTLQIAGVGLALLIVGILLHITTGLIEPKVLAYFPIFVFGVLLSKYKRPFLFTKENRYMKPFLFIAGISYAIFLIHSLIYTALVFLGMRGEIIAIVGIPAIIFASYVLTKVDRKLYILTNQ